ncbi:hypothetical protein ACH3XW_31775 [Acanthocheilonema viteae]
MHIAFIILLQGKLQEPNCEEFQRAFPNISIFSWIHFEGRNFENLLIIIKHVLLSRQNKRPTISLECEKVRDFETLENAIPIVDVVFVSKDFARKKGFQNKEEAVFGIQQKYGASRAIVICPWAEQVLIFKNFFCYSFIHSCYDTLGAGDCFIACCIHFLNEGNNLRDVLMNASRITGKKVARRGLLGLDVS